MAIITREAVAKLYLATFGRPLDTEGLGYWTNTGEFSPETGNRVGTDLTTMEGLSRSFARQTEYATNYPDGTTDTEFITAIYNNLFQRDPDSGGLAYWLNDLSLGTMTRDKAILMIMNGAQDSDDGNDLSLLNNRAEFALELADAGDFTADEAKSSDVVDAILSISDNSDTIDATRKVLNNTNRDDINFTGDDDSKIELSNNYVSSLSQEVSDTISISDFRDSESFSGIDGSGYSIVILDTGIDLDHQFFGEDADNNGVADRIVYTHDFTNDGDGTVDDVNGHGTNVASIAASSSSVYTGMAPDANIIALQVLSNSGPGSFSWLESALQWVVANADAYNITAINMSLGDGTNSNTISTNTYGLSDELAALSELGVINVAAAGNDYYRYQTEGASTLATDTNVVSVGATFDDNTGPYRWADGTTAYSSGQDEITPFSQRSDTVVDIFAPGAPSTGAAPGGTISSMTGTSQAAPVIAGVAVLAQELAEQELGRRLTQDEFVSLLNTTGVAIVDGDDEDDNVTNTGDTYRRVDVDALGEAILAMAEDDSDETLPDPIVSTDIENNTSTKGVLAVGESVSNTLEVGNDKDWFKINLVEGVEYRFDLVADSSDSNALSDPWLGIHNSAGTFIRSNDDAEGLNSSLTFIASYSGDYFLSAEAYSSTMTGDYTLSATQVQAAVEDDYSADINTLGGLESNEDETGSIELENDVDWFAVTFTAGNTYTIDLKGASTNSGTLSNAYINGIYDSTGTLIAATSDDNSGTGYNAQVVYSAQESGTYYVSATGNGSATGTYALSMTSEATVLDDYTDDTLTTGTLSLESPSTGNIEEANDIDFFEVNLVEGNRYTIDLKGSATEDGTLNDTYLRGIYNSSGTLVNATTDDDSGTGLNSQVVYEATTSGRYYVAAGAFGQNTGTYTLSMASEEITTDDYTANANTTGVLTTNASLSGDIEVADDADWISVELTEGYTYTINMQRDSLTDAEIYGLYDANSEYIIGTYSNGGVLNSDASVNFTPDESGTFYISANGYGSATGTYTLNITETLVDDYAQSINTAGLLLMDSHTYGNIESNGDIDWFAVTLTTDNTYTIDLEGDDTYRGTLNDTYINGLYDATGTLISATTNDDGGTGSNSQVTYTATASGVHYIASSSADSGTGTYKLSISESVATDDFASNITTTGTISTGSSTTGNIEESYDTDWFKVTLVANKEYVIKLEGDDTDKGTLGDTYLRGLYDSTGTLISGTTNDDAGTGLNSQVTYQVTQSGTYYISAGGYGSRTGTYTLSIDSGTDIVPDIGESITDHGTITAGTTISGVSDTSYDNDWYAVTLSAGYEYEIQADSDDTSVYLNIRDENGYNLYSSDGVTSEYVSGVDAARIFSVDTTGTYYIDVYNSYSTGTYTLSVDSGTEVLTSNTITFSEYASGTQNPVYTFDDNVVSVIGEIVRDGAQPQSPVIAANSTYVGPVYINFQNPVSHVDFDGGYFDSLSSTTIEFIGAGNTILSTELNSQTGVQNFSYDNSLGIHAVHVVNTGVDASGFSVDTVNFNAPITSVESATTFNISTTAVELDEGQSGTTPFSFTVTRTGDTASVGSVGWVATGSGENFVSASDFQDGEFPNGTLEFAAGEITKTITVNIAGDTEAEDDETFAVTLIAPSSGSSIGTASVVATVLNDEPEDIGESTTDHGTITAGTTISGASETSYDNDWYQVTLTAGQRYNIQANSEDTSVYLYIRDEDGYSLGSSDGVTSEYVSGVDAARTFSVDTTGTYYIDVYNSYTTGTYTLSVDSGTDFTPDIGESITSHGNITLGTTISGISDTSYDNDWYAVTLSAGQLYDIRANSEDTNTYLNIRDSRGYSLGSSSGVETNYITNIDAAKTFSVDTTGTYYLDVYNSSTGTYTLSIDSGITEVGESINNHSTLTLGDEVSGTFDTRYDDDWYAVSLTGGLLYSIQANSDDTAAYMYIKNSSGTTLYSGVYTDYISGVDTAKAFAVETTGTYYIDVYNSSTEGTYTLSIDEGITDIGSTTTDHGTIIAGTTVSGVSDYRYDYDWYAVTLSAGKQYDIRANSNDTSTYVTVRDSNGYSLSSSSGVETNYVTNIDAAKTFSVDTTGTYYLDVYAYESGSYTLSVDAGITEIGQSINNHSSISAGDEVSGTFDGRYDNDWYAVTLTEKLLYSIEADSDDATAYISIKDSNGSNVYTGVKSDYVSGVDTAKAFEVTTTGTYYIDIYSSSSEGTYSLSIDDGVVDIGESIASHSNITVGETISENFDYYSDNDWYAVTLTAGSQYDIRANSDDTNAYMYIRDNNGSSLYTGVTTNYITGVDTAKTFDVTTTGTYYIDVYNSSADGAYDLSIVEIA